MTKTCYSTRSAWRSRWLVQASTRRGRKTDTPPGKGLGSSRPAPSSVEALIVPADLEKALARNKKAKEHFDAFPPSAKKTILWWIESAKRDETRQRRIAETVRLAAQNVRANQ
ncbi:MAG: YdeI/OmpD-associated family protein [Actinomycetota bacterium]|nr:YdeI/OmpD-associated family protein [Actinomycetota bacterium]